MNNILVTGANGFIGKNLIAKLQNTSNNNILTFTKDNTLNELEILLSQADLIFHFAGEVKPNSSDDDFKSQGCDYSLAYAVSFS